MTERKRFIQLQQMQPEDLIEPSWLEVYEKEITAIWWQLVRLNSNLFVMEKITAFPFDLFQTTPSPFWKVTFDALFEMNIMIIWRIAIDEDSRTLTIKRLKNHVLKHLRKKIFCKEFNKDLRKIEFEKTISEVKDRVVEIRHNYIAHFNREHNINPNLRLVKENSVQLNDLKKIAMAITSLFEVLCFGHGRGEILFAYFKDVIHPIGSDPRSDIEILLDDIAKNSPILNTPEEHPDLWQDLRQQMSIEEIEMLNKYRDKFGMRNA